MKKDREQYLKNFLKKLKRRIGEIDYRGVNQYVWITFMNIEKRYGNSLLRADVLDSSVVIELKTKDCMAIMNCRRNLKKHESPTVDFFYRHINGDEKHTPTIYQKKQSKEDSLNFMLKDVDKDIATYIRNELAKNPEIEVLLSTNFDYEQGVFKTIIMKDNQLNKIVATYKI